MTKEDIQRKQLTPAQKKLILQMQQTETFSPHKGHEVRTCRILFAMGILKYVQGGLPGSAYELQEAWRDVELRLPIARGSSIFGRTEQPDPAKPKITRPPAAYSNKTREQLMDEILNSK